MTTYYRAVAMSSTQCRHKHRSGSTAARCRTIGVHHTEWIDVFEDGRLIKRVPASRFPQVEWELR